MRGYFLFNKKIWPKTEIYSYALEQLAIQASKDGLHSVLTGIGGDELTKLTFAERKYLGMPLDHVACFHKNEAILKKNMRGMVGSIEVIPGVEGISSSSLEAAISRNYIYMREGIWPQNVFIHTELNKFFHSLPPEYRENRQIIRDLLIFFGISWEFSYNTSKERFGSVFDEMMLSSHVRSILAAMKKDSVLFDLDIVDVDVFYDIWKKFSNGSQDHNILSVYTIICMELMLRNVLDADFFG